MIQRQGTWPSQRGCALWLCVVSASAFVAVDVHAQVIQADAQISGQVTTQNAAAAPLTEEQRQVRDQEARRLFEAGRTAYVDEKYLDALNYFEQAHELTDRPQLLFNIGQAADRLGQRERAAVAFRAYLSAVPEASNREEIEARIGELEASEQAAIDGTLISDGKGLRTGLYVRGAFGLGGFSDAFALDTSLGIGRLQGGATGGSIAAELAVGYAVRPGIAIAGLLAIEWAQVKELTVEDIAFEAGQVGVLGMLGGMIDWFIDARQGGHLQLGLALARIPIKGGGSNVADHEPFGAALLLGGGYEWPVRRGLGIGVLGRLTLSQLKGDNFTHNVAALSVLCSVSMF